MASLRRSKVLSPDGQTARFLYTIIKQLDLKAIDWNEVASGLDITNGHAARMRYSRFKAQIEGLPTQSKLRAPRPKKDVSAATNSRRKNKPGYEPSKTFDLKGDGDNVDVKMEQACHSDVKEERSVSFKRENWSMDTSTGPSASFEMVQIKSELDLDADNSNSHQWNTTHIKTEPSAESPNHNLSPPPSFAALNIKSSSTLPPNPSANTLGFPPGAITPTNIYLQHQATSTMPPHATVSPADLQLPPVPKPPTQMPLPTFSYPLTSMDFDFDFNAPMPPSQTHLGWQPEFDLFRPVSVKQEMMD